MRALLLSLLLVGSANAQWFAGQVASNEATIDLEFNSGRVENFWDASPFRGQATWDIVLEEHEDKFRLHRFSVHANADNVADPFIAGNWYGMILSADYAFDIPVGQVEAEGDSFWTIGYHEWGSGSNSYGCSQYADVANFAADEMHVTTDGQDRLLMIDDGFSQLFLEQRGPGSTNMYFNATAPAEIRLAPIEAPEGPVGPPDYPCTVPEPNGWWYVAAAWIGCFLLVRHL